MAWPQSLFSTRSSAVSYDRPSLHKKLGVLGRKVRAWYVLEGLVFLVQTPVRFAWGRGSDVSWLWERCTIVYIQSYGRGSCRYSYAYLDHSAPRLLGSNKLWRDDNRHRAIQRRIVHCEAREARCSRVCCAQRPRCTVEGRRLRPLVPLVGGELASA
jgi:hypothetical protein